MTEQEKQEIITELEQRLEQKFSNRLTKQGSQTILKVPREKWFKDTNNSGQQSLMSEVFNSPYASWKIWDAIRKLTCIVCGKNYVQQLADIEDADEVAEKLCQFVYDLKKEREKHETV